MLSSPSRAAFWELGFLELCPSSGCSPVLCRCCISAQSVNSVCLAFFSLLSCIFHLLLEAAQSRKHCSECLQSSALFRDAVCIEPPLSLFLRTIREAALTRKQSSAEPPRRILPLLSRLPGLSTAHPSRKHSQLLRRFLEKGRVGPALLSALTAAAFPSAAGDPVHHRCALRCSLPSCWHLRVAKSHQVHPCPAPLGVWRWETQSQ